MVTGTTASTVSLQWNEPELANGIITNYIVQFYQPSDPSAVTVFSDSSVATSITVDGLDAFTQYTFTVAAMTVERGPFAEINATTAESGICTCMCMYYMIQFIPTTYDIIYFGSHSIN